MAMHKDDLIIDIDDQVEVLLQQINSAPNQRQQHDFVESFQNMLIDQVLGPFGLSRELFKDRDGGAITSLHNFEKGVVANDADSKRHASWVEANSSQFDRKGNGNAQDYDAQLKAERKPLFQDTPVITSAYTGKELPKDGRTHRDHVISAAEIERSSQGHLGQSREERVKTANSRENLVWAESGLNQSKGDLDAIQWAEKTKNRDGVKKTNTEHFDVDEELLKGTYKEAKTAVEGTQKQAVLMKQGGELLVEGGKAAGYLALRQVLGMILKDVVQGLTDDVRYLVREGFNGARSLLELVQDRLQATFRNLREKWAEYLKEGTSAGLSGFFSTLITLVINSFITTAKNIVTLIREAVLALARSIKVIVAPPAGMSKGEIAFEVLRLLSAAVATCVGLALEETIKKALESIALLAPVAGELAPIIAGIITGGLTLFTVLAFDRIKDAIAFRNKQLADVHRGQAIGLLKIKQTVLMLDSAYENMTMTAQTLRIQFEESWIEVQESREQTQRSIASYQSSVRALDDLLEQF
ncbi:hypothetical protein [Aquipseudomonas alcaligenes]|uniref:hypothetical protein n=1 Tax=Aquipseudomonas alcaligenes TaxID=43263 RepID=UPI0037485AF9